MVEPSVWGPIFWKAIHYIAMGYPEDPSQEDAATYRAFFQLLGSVIPCAKCRENYARHAEAIPIDNSLSNRQDLFTWTVALHNAVNAETGKQTVSVQEALDMLLAPPPVGDAQRQRNEPMAQQVTQPKQATTVWVPVGVGLLTLLVTVTVAYVLVRRFRSPWARP